MGSKFESRFLSDRELSAQLGKMEQALHDCERIAISSQYVVSLVDEIEYPLESIANLAYLIEREDLPQTARDYMRQMGEQLSTLIAIMRDAAKFRHGREALENVDLVMVAKSALRLHAARLSRSRVNVHRRFAEDAMCPAVGSELLHVVSNLVLNSLEALVDHAPHGSLHVRVHRHPDTVRITIADNGGGIPADVENLLFEPHVGTKQQGRGLALWLARRIVEKHAGSLTWRTSRTVGKSGTIFRIALPCPRQEKSRTAA